VEAGFPSPADDSVERDFDLNEELIGNPVSTYYVRVKGESMRDALATFPDHPNINYNLGCYSARLGKIEEARRLVAIAIELDPIFKEPSLEDEDLKTIW
jgi:hypothetical protein